MLHPLRPSRLTELFTVTSELRERVTANRQALAPLFAFLIAAWGSVMSLLSAPPSRWGWLAMTVIAISWLPFGKKHRNGAAAIAAGTASFVPPLLGLTGVIHVAPAPVEVVWIIISIGVYALILPFRWFLPIWLAVLTLLAITFASNEAIPGALALHTWAVIALASVLVGLYAAVNELQHLRQVRENRALKQFEESFRSLTEVLVAAQGRESLEPLTRELASVLEVDWTVVALLQEDGGSWKGVSYSRDDDRSEEFELLRGKTIFDRAAMAEVTPGGEQVDLRDDPWLVERGLSSVVFVPIQDARGALLGVIGACSRVSATSRVYPRWILRAVAVRVGMELERAEKDWLLRESEQRYRTLFDAAEDLICTHDLDGRILMANRALERFFGGPLEGSSIRDFIDPEFRHQFGDYISSVRSSSTAAGYLAVRDGLGRKRILEFRNRRTVLPDGQAVVLGIGRDSTEKLEAARIERTRAENLHARLQKREEDLAWRQKFFANLADMIPVGLLQLDSEGVCMFANRALGELAGCEAADLLGVGWQRLFDENDLMRIRDLQQQAPDLESVVELEIPLIGVRGPVPVLCRMQYEPGDSDYDPPQYWTLTDLSEIRKKDEMLNRSKRMSELGTLVGRIAHEVRNPLFGLTSVTDLIELKAETDEHLSRYAPMIRTETDRLTKLMSDLLDFGRPLELNMEEVDLHRLLHRALAYARDRYDGVQIEWEESITDVHVHGDPVALLEVLENVLDNAIQHSGSERPLRVYACTDGPMAIVSVWDSGPGFSATALSNLFEPFFTERKDGTGLGMAIVKRIVDEHGGTISHENHDEGGGVVELRLPVAQPAAS